MANQTIYISNLPYSTTKDQIVTLVQPRVTKRITLTQDRDTGRPTGYGFIEFYDAEDATTAVRFLDGIDFGGRTIRCSMAKEKERGGRQ
jgi:RNA recognition motif-containing protein